MVSEFMLQQTTVTAVVPYFERWMERFPTLESLASAEESEVLGLWQGLGYYSRARNLLAAAKILSGRGGGVSDDPEVLRSLPGFGEYTAMAVLAFAFDRPVSVIDANIARVLARLGDIRDLVDKASGRQRIRSLAGELLPAKVGGREHTSALMDLGATVCTARDPTCNRCPVRAFCLAENPSALPMKKPRAVPTTLTENRVFVFRNGRIALVCSDGPRWRGLWLLPEGDPAGQPIHQQTYAITRYRVELLVFGGSCKPAHATFFPVDQLPPMPSPHARAVAALLAKLRSDAS